MDNVLHFDGPPSALAYHLRALAPARARRSSGAMPLLRATWDGFRVAPEQLADIASSSLLPEHSAWDILVPQILAFRLQMVVLTHPAFPFSIWSALQIRNSIQRLGPTPRDAALQVETCIDGHRALAKGVEIDLLTTLRRGDALCWRGVTTFYYRGRRMPASPPAPEPGKAPEVAGAPVAEWTTRPGGARRYAALSGDYNGIHYGSWYARLFGFRGAFFHPQRILAQAMAHLQDRPSGERQQLQVWFKGPVYYGARVALHARRDASGLAFALHADGDHRPAIVARWSSDPAAPE